MGTRSTGRGTSRRDYLKRASLGGAAAALSAAGLGEAARAGAVPVRRRALRIAQVTDVHVQPELGAGEGLRQCLAHIRAQPDPVDLVLNTGDAVMDCLSQDADRVTLIWDLWDRTLAEGCQAPVRHVLGNHDIWGYDKANSKTTGREPLWGKGLAMSRLKLAKPYYSFDQAGWHLIGLDTVHQAGDHYRTGIDDPQMAWLESDLAATPPATPVMVFSHIPIVGVAPLLANDAAASGNFVVPGTKVLLDNVRVKNLFKRFANVKLCVSGHIHLVDQIEYLGVTYLCGGAVSGDYWKGIRNGECDAGYSLIDLYDDGSFDRQYVTYGWRYRA